MKRLRKNRVAMFSLIAVIGLGLTGLIAQDESGDKAADSESTSKESKKSLLNLLLGGSKDGESTKPPAQPGRPRLVPPTRTAPPRLVPPTRPATPEAPTVTTPEAPKTPYIPEAPKVPEVPSVPTPEAPKTPEVPEAPKVPEVPSVPTPAAPKTPEVPEAPKVPEVPSVPTPEAPKTPEVPEAPKPPVAEPTAVEEASPESPAKPEPVESDTSKTDDEPKSEPGSPEQPAEPTKPEESKPTESDRPDADVTPAQSNPDVDKPAAPVPHSPETILPSIKAYLESQKPTDTVDRPAAPDTSKTITVRSTDPKPVAEPKPEPEAPAPTPEPATPAPTPVPEAPAPTPEPATPAPTPEPEPAPAAPEQPIQEPQPVTPAPAVQPATPETTDPVPSEPATPPLHVVIEPEKPGKDPIVDGTQSGTPATSDSGNAQQADPSVPILLPVEGDHSSNAVEAATPAAESASPASSEQGGPEVNARPAKPSRQVTSLPKRDWGPIKVAPVRGVVRHNPTYFKPYRLKNDRQPIFRTDDTSSDDRVVRALSDARDDLGIRDAAEAFVAPMKAGVDLFTLPYSVAKDRPLDIVQSPGEPDEAIDIHPARTIPFSQRLTRGGPSNVRYRDDKRKLLEIKSDVDAHLEKPAVESSDVEAEGKPVRVVVPESKPVLEKRMGKGGTSIKMTDTYIEPVEDQTSRIRKPRRRGIPGR